MLSVGALADTRQKNLHGKPSGIILTREMEVLGLSVTMYEVTDSLTKLFSIFKRRDLVEEIMACHIRRCFVGFTVRLDSGIENGP